MTHQTPERKPRPAPTACTCVRCGRALTNPIYSALGTVGHECAKHLNVAKEQLTAAGLGALAEHGELRLPAVRQLDGTYRAPEGTQQLTVLADRLGVRLGLRFDAGAKQFVLAATPASLRALLTRAKGVAA